jgi:hypothetical protein
MRRLITISRVLATVANVAVAVLIGGDPAVAANPARAGLVIDHGDGRMAYAIVTFDEEEIPGAELIDRSGVEVTEVSFGGLGVAVCAIDETGCDIATCRKRVCQGPARDDPYWQYFVRSAEGTWQVAALGLSGDSIADGGVRAFIWSAGVPDFPAPSIDEIARMAGQAGDGGVALTRYAPDGSIADNESSDSGADVPFAGIAVVVVAVVIVGGVIVRKRSDGAR